jgi:EAL domain-containing protein (putative c-di-GMP-specific phosphodiesterase class I)
MLPADFLPATYGHPIAVEVGEWVIRAALTQLDVWREQLRSAAVSVNLDAHHIQQPDFCDRLLALVSEHGSTVAQGLEFEVLESSSMENIAAVAEVMGRCRGLGVTFAIDDFGTGYSSLTYLRRLPAARIKVDQSFVCDMLEDPEDAAMVKNVIDMAHSLDRAVIAEGVETVQHLDALRALGCDLAQGFGIARPMPAEDVPAWCERWQAAGDGPFV